MNVPTKTHNEWLVHRAVMNDPHSRHERLALLEALDEEEELLAVAKAGRGFRRPGLLAITDRRMIHVYFRHLLRCAAVFELRYQDVGEISAPSWKSSGELAVRLRGRPRTIHFPILGSRSREVAEELAERAQKGLARSRFQHGE
jgi:hypothetical protein